jgi:hypothetical protein
MPCVSAPCYQCIFSQHRRERKAVRPPTLTGAGGTTGVAGIERAIALGWLWQHESGTYLQFTDSGAALFA